MKRGGFMPAGILLICLGAILGLGFCAWGVTSPVRNYLHRVSGPAGWSFTVDRAVWIPWKGLKMAGLRVQAPGGGRLYLVEVEMAPRIVSLIHGGLMTEWAAGEIRMDPVSWGISRSMAQEMLSSGPVSTGGTARIQWRVGECRLDQFQFKGPMLRAAGQGWLRKGQSGYLDVQGELSQGILQGMALLPESFAFRLEGNLASPRLEFHSRFLNIAPRQPKENRA
jgi:hypothetical protein